MTSIFKRDVMDEITRFLNTDDLVIIHGARQVGKTSILAYLQAQLVAAGELVHYIDLEDGRLLSILDRGVDEFLLYLKETGFNLSGLTQTGKKIFVLIDEIQYLANPSSFLKLLADHHRYLKIIVSGSSSFEMKSKFRDSLVGRTVNFEIYPLSFREFLAFRGISFLPAERFTAAKIAELQSLYFEFALYGGYPKIVLTGDASVKDKYLQQIIDTYVRKDIRDLADIKDVNKFNRLLETLASQSGNLLNVSELANTCALTAETVQRYLFLLEQTYIIRLVRPFSRNLRSELTKTPKIFFHDTGLMQMLWLKRLPREIMGSVFETSIFGELVKQHGVNAIYYWRTKEKQELDFVLNLPDGLMPCEVKLQFPRALPSGLLTFARAYSVQSPKLIGLNGEPNSLEMIYPWQL